MNIVTSVKVYPQGGTVETVSQKKKNSTSCCPESASKSCLMIRAPLSGKGSKDKRLDEFDFFLIMLLSICLCTDISLCSR